MFNKASYGEQTTFLAYIKPSMMSCWNYSHQSQSQSSHHINTHALSHTRAFFYSSQSAISNMPPPRPPPEPASNDARPKPSKKAGKPTIGSASKFSKDGDSVSKKKPKGSKKKRKRAKERGDKRARKERRAKQQREEAEARKEQTRREEEQRREEQKWHAQNPKPGISSQQGDREKYGFQYHRWAKACETFFEDKEAPFPRPHRYGCKQKRCIRGDKLNICHHDVEKTLRGSGMYSEKWLRKERLRWHPDKFSGRPEVRDEAQELFQLIERVREGEGER